MVKILRKCNEEKLQKFYVQRSRLYSSIIFGHFVTKATVFERQALGLSGTF